MLPWSVSARWLIPSDFARLTRASMEDAPSRSEKSEWQCRWTNGVTRPGPLPPVMIPACRGSVNTCGSVGMWHSAGGRGSLRAHGGGQAWHGTAAGNGRATSCSRGSATRSRSRARAARSSRTARRTACGRWMSRRAAASISRYCPGRGMDIPFASFNGRAIGFVSGTGHHLPRLLRGGGARVEALLLRGSAHDVRHRQRRCAERRPGPGLRPARAACQRRGGKRVRRPGLGRGRVRHPAQGHHARMRGDGARTSRSPAASRRASVTRGSGCRTPSSTAASPRSRS